jgi:hypothetical protein
MRGVEAIQVAFQKRMPFFVGSLMMHDCDRVRPTDPRWRPDP